MSDYLPENPTGGSEVPAWVVTFGDMMALLLTFFVLLFASSEIDAKKYKSISDSMREAFGAQRMEWLLEAPNGKNLTVEEVGQESSGLLDELHSITPQAFPGATIQDTDGRGVLVTVPGNLMFDSGEAILKDVMRPYLRKIADLIKGRPNRLLQVEGHTDDIPINTPRFQSNWDLSAARAIAVIRFLIEECQVPPGRLAAAGYADAHPLVTNNSPQNREKNRRVEFRFAEIP